MTLKWIETHCHLDYLKQDTLENIYQRSLSAQIEKIITISVEPKNLNSVLDLITRFEFVYGTQGIHPHESHLFDETVEAAIRDQIQNHPHKNKIVAVGEIGLDYYYLHSPKDVQQRVFEQQLQIAIDLDKPVVIHTRDADEDTRAILKNFSGRMKRKGVLHSFTSSKELALFAIEEGFSLGFNGILTFKTAENVREVASLCPLPQMLLETDSPFLTPIPHRGKENAPFYLPFVAMKMAELKQISVEELAQITTENAYKLFRL